jgi:hypothetical protein
MPPPDSTQEAAQQQQQQGWSPRNAGSEGVHDIDTQDSAHHRAALEDVMQSRGESEEDFEEEEAPSTFGIFVQADSHRIVPHLDK